MHKLILLVDDDLASLALARQVLERSGHLVITATTGLDARRALDAAKFDVVVTDIFMPDMDGLELIRHICNTGRSSPIIAMSGGSGAPNFLPVAEALGADLVLQKPVSPSALLRAVDDVSVDPAKGLRRASAAMSPVSEASVTARVVALR
jgi:CheY-like chemotaxis protein